MKEHFTRRRATGFALSLVLALQFASLTGCMTAATPPPTPTSTPVPSPTPSPQVTFVVAVTPVPVRHHHPATPTPVPTRFVQPKGAYLLLHPPSGPPISRTISITGGHFPPNTPVTLGWSPDKRSTPLSTSTMSDKSGNIQAELSIPASTLGTYRIVAVVDGSRYAVARYHIVSAATLSASVTPAQSGGVIRIVGKKFLRRLKLTLIAYSTVGGRQPIVLGNVQADAHGSFIYTDSASKLQPGQYVLRAWSLSAVVAQMAETYFEVVV